MSEAKSKELKILFFGDVVGRPGRQAVKKVVEKVKANFTPDLVIANVENAAHGKGVTEKTLKELAAAGVDVFTSGEHIFDKAKEAEAAEALFKNFPTLLKPANFAPERPARSEVVLDTPAGKVLVVSLIGQVFFRYKSLSPWELLPEIIARHRGEKPAAIIVDFHAEATSEKVAFSQHFDGQVSAVLGTHTHVPTADAAILPQGTAYVTDVGMNGPAISVLGMKSERSIARFLTGEMVAYEIAEGDSVWQNYVIITLDASTGRAKKIEHEHQVVSL